MNWLYLLGIVVFILGIVLAIALHEAGHLLAAKRFQALVPRYMVGFGPTLVSKTFGETEYGIKAILLGGYVRILGMYAPARPGVKTHRRDGRPTIAQDAREFSMEEIPAGLEDRAFFRLPVRHKLAIMFAGPFMNLLLSAVFLALSLLLGGVAYNSSTLAVVEDCQGPTATSSVCEELQGKGPAYTAGLRAGDTITTWGGHTVVNWDQLRQAIRQTSAGPVQVEYMRDGQPHTATVQLSKVTRPVVDENGVPQKDDNGQVRTEQVPYAGLGSLTKYRSAGLGDIAGQYWQLLSGTAKVIVVIPQSLWNATQSIFGWVDRDTTGVIGLVGVGRVAGEIASVRAGEVSFADRAAAMSSLMASLNMALGVFNLIPLLPLDGGHIAGAMWEGIRRYWARLRGKPDPGAVDIARILPVTYLVVGFLVLMTIILVAADLVAPIV